MHCLFTINPPISAAAYSNTFLVFAVPFRRRRLFHNLMKRYKSETKHSSYLSIYKILSGKDCNFYMFAPLHRNFIQDSYGCSKKTHWLETICPFKYHKSSNKRCIVLVLRKTRESILSFIPSF